ncbi:MAG: hypothetical protein WEB19_02285 [Acidimicrobiia bacterium]
MHGIIDAELIHVESRGHPNQPHGSERGRDDTDHLRLGVVAHGVAERDDRGCEHEVVEQLEPSDLAFAACGLGVRRAPELEVGLVLPYFVRRFL